MGLADRDAVLAATRDERREAVYDALGAIAGAPDLTFRHSVDRTRAEEFDSIRHQAGLSARSQCGRPR
jgi:hypothetical protein